MLLHRLREHALSRPDAAPFHRQRGFSWRISLDDQGRPIVRELQAISEPDTKGKARPVRHIVPSAVRTVGVAPNLAADDVQYVLGWADASSKPARVAQCHEGFVDLVHRWADSPEGRADHVAQAVATFYRNGGPDQISCDQPVAAKDAVLITVGGTPAYQGSSVVPFWMAEVASRKGSDRTGLCLVCGTSQPLLDTVPGKIPARLVPGASNDAALVSVNERVFGYDLTTQLSGSPMCLPCGESIIAGLHAVLDSEHATTFSGQDSRMAWWVSGGGESRAVRLLFDSRPDPNEVNDLIGSLHSGHRKKTDLGTRFCSLTVGGNVARIMVRDWVEMPLVAVEDNVGRWFNDHEVVSSWGRGRIHGLTRLALVTGRWQSKTNQYALFGAKGGQRPNNVQRDLLRAAIRGTPLPPDLLTHLVNRIRTDGGLDDARAALLRLALVRSPSTRKKPMPDLDETNNDPAYVAGRLFASYEKLQYDVSEGKLNSSYRDRHFAGAFTNPRAALVNGERTATAWLKKLRRSKPGAAVNHEKRIDALMKLLNARNGLPARMTPSDQATFAIGYHHQRAHLFNKTSTPEKGTAA